MAVVGVHSGGGRSRRRCRRRTVAARRCSGAHGRTNFCRKLAGTQRESY